MQHHPLLHLFPHQLIYTADHIMCAGQASFYSALELIIDSVSCVLLPPQEEESGSAKRVWEEKYIQGAGQSFLDLEVLVVEVQI